MQITGTVIRVYSYQIAVGTHEDHQCRVQVYNKYSEIQQDHFGTRQVCIILEATTSQQIAIIKPNSTEMPPHSELFHGSEFPKTQSAYCSPSNQLFHAPPPKPEWGQINVFTY